MTEQQVSASQQASLATDLDLVNVGQIMYIHENGNIYQCLVTSISTTDGDEQHILLDVITAGQEVTRG